MMSRTGSVLLALVCVAGCNDVTHYEPGSPVMPGGGGTGTGSQPKPDALLAIADGGIGTIFGTVCQRTTVAPQACTALLGAAGLTITLRENDTTTQVANDGSFAIRGIPGTARVTLVTATDSALFYGGAVTVALDSSGSGRANIPVFALEDADALGSNGGGLGAGTGFLVVHTGTGITLTDGDSQVFYDVGEAPVLSTTGPTGTSGTAIVFNVVGAQTLGLVRDTTTVPAAATVFAGAATFVEVPF